MQLPEVFSYEVRLGLDEPIDIGAVRDAAGQYRRATVTLRQIVCLMLDELAARGVPSRRSVPDGAHSGVGPPCGPTPPDPERPKPEPPVIGLVPETAPGMSPVVARVLDERRRQPRRPGPPSERWDT